MKHLFLLFLIVEIGCSTEVKNRNESSLSGLVTKGELTSRLDQNTEIFKSYINSLLLFESSNPDNWDMALNNIKSLNVSIPRDHDRLLGMATEISDRGSKARSELLEYAKLTKLSFVFEDKYSPEQWKSTFESVKKYGIKGKMVVSLILLSQLGKSYSSSYWEEVRYYLVELGDVSFGLVSEYVREQIKAIPNTQIYLIPDELVQSIACLSSMGKKGIDEVRSIYLTSSNIYAKRSCIIGLAEVQDLDFAITLIEDLLKSADDLDHQFGYHALSKYSSYKSVAEGMIRKYHAKDFDLSCKRQIFRTIAALKLKGCSDILISEVNTKMKEDAINSLKKLTGLMYDSSEQWMSWYGKTVKGTSD